jgi:hypothetical protein
VARLFWIQTKELTFFVECGLSGWQETGEVEGWCKFPPSSFHHTSWQSLENHQAIRYHENQKLCYPEFNCSIVFMKIAKSWQSQTKRSMTAFSRLFVGCTAVPSH